MAACFSLDVLTPTVRTAGCWEDVTMHLSSRGSTLPEKLNFPPPASLVEEKYFWTASSPTFPAEMNKLSKGPSPAGALVPPTLLDLPVQPDLKGTLSILTETSYLIQWWVLGRSPIK